MSGDDLDRLRMRAVCKDRTTGLPVYPMLIDELRRQLGTRRRVGVLHVDLDQVELVESLYGWQAFDALAARIGSELRHAIGVELPATSLLAVVRVPADRFVAFVPATDEGHEPDAAFLSSLRAAVSDRLHLALGSDDLTAFAPRARVRVGYSLLSENPFYRFERRVHAAVDEAGAQPARRQSERDRVWRAEIHRIIRDAAVTVVFQPIVHLDSGKIFGFEALARGPRNTDFESPRTLFALGERFGASSDLDRVCHAAALADAVLAGFSGSVFLNMQPESLADALWRRRDPRAEEGREARSFRVVAEVSERAIADAVARVSASRDALREEGIALSLDDVGTGYESLLTLERVRPDFVKVDAALVKGIHGNRVQQELFASLADAGRRVGAQVVAVGVESELDAETVRALGASLGQGFALGRPAKLGQIASETPRGERP